MRAFRHWTARYIADRLATLKYELTHPDHPWLTPAANEFLEQYLRKTDIGLEFGSGRSTIWLANRLERLTSVEHDPIWAAKVEDLIRTQCIGNVEYKLTLKNEEETDPSDSAYVRQADAFAPESLDFVLIDGIYRDCCTLRVLEKVRPGGVLVVDNINWYLPSNSRSPNSRNLRDNPSDPLWQDVERQLSHWRRIWTTSGVTDTGIFFSPCL